MKGGEKIKKTLKVGSKFYNWFDACANKNTAKARAKKLRAKGKMVRIKKYKVPSTGGTTWHLYTRWKD